MRGKRIIGFQKEAADADVPARSVEFTDCVGGGKTEVDRELKVEATVPAFLRIGTGGIMWLMYRHFLSMLAPLTWTSQGTVEQRPKDMNFRVIDRLASVPT
jgi:hypothetical protein